MHRECSVRRSARLRGLDSRQPTKGEHMAEQVRADGVGVVGGVDTHRDFHVGAVVDGAGRLLGSAQFGADTSGYAQLVASRGVGSAGSGWKERAATAPGSRWGISPMARVACWDPPSSGLIHAYLHGVICPGAGSWSGWCWSRGENRSEWAANCPVRRLDGVVGKDRICRRAEGERAATAPGSPLGVVQAVKRPPRSAGCGSPTSGCTEPGVVQRAA